MRLEIGCSEAVLLNDARTFIKDGIKNFPTVRKLGFVDGATVNDIYNNRLCDVTGSDEMGFSITGVTHVRVQRKTRYHQRQLVVTVDWQRPATSTKEVS